MGTVPAVMASGHGMLRASLVSVCLSCADVCRHVVGSNVLPEAAEISNFVPRILFYQRVRPLSPNARPESCRAWTRAALTRCWKEQGTPGEASWVPGTWISCQKSPLDVDLTAELLEGRRVQPLPRRESRSFLEIRIPLESGYPTAWTVGARCSQSLPTLDARGDGACLPPGGRCGMTSDSLLFSRAALNRKEALSGYGLSFQACVDPKTEFVLYMLDSIPASK